MTFMDAILGIYTGVESEMFSAGELFTALALFNQLAVCLSVFPVTVPIFIKGFVSRNRIKSFLDKQEALGTYISLDTSTQADEDELLVMDACKRCNMLMAINYKSHNTVMERKNARSFCPQ